MTLQMPKAAASRSTREIKAMGSANSVSVGWYSGARGRFFSHAGISEESDMEVDRQFQVLASPETALEKRYGKDRRQFWGRIRWGEKNREKEIREGV